jgi:hypothetical protein
MRTPDTQKPGKKYFKGRLYRDGKMYPYVVWDGKRDYENVPPPELGRVLIKSRLLGNRWLASNV